MTSRNAVGRAVRAPERSPARTLRGVLAGLTSGIGAVVAHYLAGGHSSTGVAVAVMFLSVAVGTGVARRRIGPTTALALAAIAQGSSHLLMAGSGAHEHAAQAAHMGQAAPGHVAGHGGVAMLLLHLLVVLATALAVRGADQAVLDAARALVSWFLLPTRLSPGPLPTARRGVVAAGTRALTPRRAAQEPWSRRGPPVDGLHLLPLPS